MQALRDDWEYYSSQPIITDTGNHIDLSKMGLNESKIAECVQSLCEIFFHSNAVFLSKNEPGNQVQDTIGFLLYSCCVRCFFVSDGFLQGENRKNTRTLQEHNRKNILKCTVLIRPNA